MKKRITPLLFILIVIGCGIKPKFNDEELSWLNVYDEGDTMIFRSENNAFDTTIVVAKQIFYPDYNPVESHGAYLPQYGIVWYKNSQLIYHDDGDQLITLIKKTPNDKTFLSINYKYSGFIFLDITGDKLKKYLKGNQYEFESPDPGVDSIQPKKLVWDRDKGIIRYVTGDNIVWQRVK